MNDTWCLVYAEGRGGDFSFSGFGETKNHGLSFKYFFLLMNTEVSTLLVFYLTNETYLLFSTGLNAVVVVVVDTLTNRRKSSPCSQDRLQ